MREAQAIDFLDFDQSTEQKGVQTSPSAMSQHLVFSVAGLEMTVSLEQVSEIVPYERVSSLPGMPPYIRGVTQVRERWTPVIDLSLKFGLPPAQLTNRSCILVLDLDVHGESVAVGIVLDAVATLLELDTSRISPAPRFGLGVDVKYMKGLVVTERGSMPLIDFAQIFADAELDYIAAGAAQTDNQRSLTR